MKKILLIIFFILMTYTTSMGLDQFGNTSQGGSDVAMGNPWIFMGYIVADASGTIDSICGFYGNGSGATERLFYIVIYNNENGSTEPDTCMAISGQIGYSVAYGDTLIQFAPVDEYSFVTGDTLWVGWCMHDDSKGNGEYHYDDAKTDGVRHKYLGVPSKGDDWGATGSTNDHNLSVYIVYTASGEEAAPTYRRRRLLLGG